MLFGIIPDIIESILYAVRNEPDGKMAFALGERLGVIPSAKTEQQLNQMTSEEEYERMKTTVAYQLGMVAFDRHDVYGTALPVDEEELKALVEKADAEKSKL